MALFVKEYSFVENDSIIQVTFPLKGISPKNVWVSSTNNYVKVSFPPFLFEAFLLKEIDDKKSKATIGNESIILTLTKTVPGIWNVLEEPICDKKTLMERRSKAEQDIQQKITDKLRTAEEQRTRQKKYSIQQQMELEASKKQWIKTMREKEINAFKKDMKNWTNCKQNNERAAGDSSTTSYSAEKKIMPVNKTVKPSIEQLPPPREQKSITVNFTERVFPTPSRESQAEEEEKWLQKQAMARRTLDSKNYDLKPEEQDPVWLKEKGDSFFCKKNYQAAINAYSLAIRLNCKLPGVYSNRAACHLKLRNLHKAIEDSSKALELLLPAVPSNAESRKKAHTRRGTAFCGLELYVEGLLDYEAALKIDPQNKELHEDAQKIREIIQCSNQL